jgi:hypothetical protein
VQALGGFRLGSEDHSHSETEALRPVDVAEPTMAFVRRQGVPAGVGAYQPVNGSGHRANGRR